MVMNMKIKQATRWIKKFDTLATGDVFIMPADSSKVVYMKVDRGGCIELKNGWPRSVESDTLVRVYPDATLDLEG